jgi:hypothetical protein
VKKNKLKAINKNLSGESTRAPDHTIFLLAALHPTDPEQFTPMCYGWCFYNEIEAVPPNGMLMMRMDWLVMRLMPTPPEQGLPMLEFPPPALIWHLTQQEFQGAKPFLREEINPNIMFRMIWIRPPNPELLKEVIKKANQQEIAKSPQDTGPSRIIIPRIVPPSDLRR